MHHNLIAGEWLAGTGLRRNINPSDTNDLVGEYAHADAAQTDRAIQAARQAFPAWSRGSVQARADALEKIAAELLARKDELGNLLAREEGKTLPEAVGEVARAGQIFRFFAGEVVRASGEHLPSVRPGIEVDITREPIGVVGIITPWNFPIAIPAWKIAPALAYGNCVVFKPADLVPGSAWALAEIISRSGIPPGVFNLVMGPGSQVGQTLLNHTDIDAISFTGSVDTGRRVLAATAPRFAKVQLEMGGKNPLVVLDDADLARAVECAVQGSYFSTGQRCTASSRLIVQRGILPRFTEAVVERLKTVKVDDARTPGTDIGPVVDESQLAQDLSYIQIGQDEGARLAFGGRVLARATQGFYLEPALFVDAEPGMRIAREEIFGPVACIVPADNFEHALALANDTAFGLSAGICTSSLKHATQFKREAQAGMVMVNAATAGVDYHVPFGGRKGSSYGPREQGRYAAEFFTTVKTAYTAA
ncbi:aldehyde dehydrogenase family protein [Hydrogenophaga atypica]|uniref:Aldehyde dehydrogenase family protein n=1 Tax=Hydrogenophaga atypica TaxID=249409 RepID=A0ABW2QLS6_9BURK